MTELYDITNYIRVCEICKEGREMYSNSSVKETIIRPGLYKTQNALRECRHDSQLEASVVAIDASDWPSRLRFALATYADRILL